MITGAITKEQIAEWKQIYEDNHNRLTPNRKTGYEVDAYFRACFPYEPLQDANFQEVVAHNILENEVFFKKLPAGIQPEVHCYKVGDVLVGIDVISGCFHIECEEVEKAIPIYDALFVYRGLDMEDLQNYVMVAQFILLTQ